jgi:uncharacterized membrane protein
MNIRLLAFIPKKRILLLTGEERAEAERQRAEAERQRAETAEQENARLREQLRALGVDPDALM